MMHIGGASQWVAPHIDVVCMMFLAVAMASSCDVQRWPARETIMPMRSRYWLSRTDGRYLGPASNRAATLCGSGFLSMKRL